MVGAEYQRANYPTTWARMYEKGRVFYTSFGHREDVWTTPAFQSLLAGALNWALRRVEADVTPNLSRVTPKAGVLPRYVPPQQQPAAGTKKNDKREEGSHPPTKYAPASWFLLIVVARVVIVGVPNPRARG
jgi:hypothetical protein